MANITDDVDETELNEDKRYEQYTREIEYLDKLQIANTGDFGRAIRYFSGFAIPIFLTITDIPSSKKPCHLVDSRNLLTRYIMQPNSTFSI